MAANPFVVLFASVILVLQSGCASWAEHGVIAGEDAKYHVAVAPVFMTADIHKASDLMSNPPKLTNEPDFVNQRIHTISRQISGYLDNKLDNSEYFDVVSLQNMDEDTRDIFSSPPQSWRLEKLHSLRTKRNIQAILVVKVSGYGKIKKKWLVYLLGSGVVEGVVQGVLAAKLVKNNWVGLVVGLEEIGQEILVWGGGSYLFDQHYAPVTLESELISTRDGKSIWDDTVFVSVDKDAIEKLPKQEQNKKEKQLLLTAQKAINKLVEDINKKAKNNLRPEYDSSDNFGF